VQCSAVQSSSDGEGLAFLSGQAAKRHRETSSRRRAGGRADSETNRRRRRRRTQQEMTRPCSCRIQSMH
jgi:hypothetical protein